eukprot:701345_1
MGVIKISPKIRATEHSVFTHIMISRYSLVRVTILLALLSRFTISKDSDTHNNKLVSGYIKQTCGTKNTVYKDIEHLLETFYLDPSRQTTEVWSFEIRSENVSLSKQEASLLQNRLRRCKIHDIENPDVKVTIGLKNTTVKVPTNNHIFEIPEDDMDMYCLSISCFGTTDEENRVLKKFFTYVGWMYVKFFDLFDQQFSLQLASRQNSYTKKFDEDYMAHIHFKVAESETYI